MTNRELYNSLKEKFPDIVSGYWDGFPYTKYSKEYLLAGLNEVAQEILDNKCTTREQGFLTERQTYLAMAVISLCTETKDKLVGDAIHQLADCVDNFRELEREINLTEYILYSSLLNMVIATVRSCSA